MNEQYERTGPTEDLVNGKRCVNTDAESILALREHYRTFKVK